jgi:O-methyltransferase involved in polyketide biosynthesis
VSVRTLILDTAVREFLGKNGDAVIINLGAGLDTRFERLNDARISMWYDVDLPDVIDLRKRFFSEGPRTISYRVPFLTGNVWHASGTGRY